MNSIIPGTIEEPGLDTHKVGTLEAPSGAVNMHTIKGQVAVITGAAGGIGRAVATAFAQAGARVCAVDVKADALAEVLPTLPGGPHRADAVDLRELSGHGIREFVNVHAVVGYGPHGPGGGAPEVE